MADVPNVVEQSAVDRRFCCSLLKTAESCLAESSAWRCYPSTVQLNPTGISRTSPIATLSKALLALRLVLLFRVITISQKL